jgi:glycosyltransferase involved in cell wall biosynthesis
MMVMPEWLRSERDATFNILSVYAERIVRTTWSRWAGTFDIAYAPSDFLVDLLPAIRMKQRGVARKLVVCLFLVAPPPGKSYRSMFTGGRSAATRLRTNLYYATQQIALRLMRRYADKILVLNSMDRDSIAPIVGWDRVSVVSMGVDYSQYANVSRSESNHYDAVFVGRLHPQKGIEDLPEIWQAVNALAPGSRLAVIGGGDPSSGKALEREIARRGLTHTIDLLGFRAGAEKIATLKSAKVFLMPSYYESWGMVIAEALAAGLPVVAYDLPIYRELFNAGVVTVPIGRIDQFAVECARLIKDTEARTKLRSAGEHVAAAYDWRLVSRTELQLFEQLLAG